MEKKKVEMTVNRSPTNASKKILDGKERKKKKKKRKKFIKVSSYNRWIILVG